MYDYAFSCYGKGSIKRASDNRYLGYVSDEFVKQHFIPEYELNTILVQLDKMCDNILNF